MGIIFHSLPLAPFLGELVSFSHEMQPLQVVFRRRLAKERDALLCNILSGVFLNMHKMTLCCPSPWIFHFFLSCLVWLGISVKLCSSPAWPRVTAGILTGGAHTNEHWTYSSGSQFPWCLQLWASTRYDEVTHLVQLIFPKKKSLLKLSGILSSSPALWVFAGDDLLCSGNYCRCSGVSKGAKAKARSLVLPGICWLFALPAHIPWSSLPVLPCLWGHGPDRNKKFALC